VSQAGAGERDDESGAGHARKRPDA